ncbi:EAL domain-containing protein [Spirochaetia bacterium 38H-sp]|uniref:EAL domain-containing protein n=1 Tax=Rarispira pelagica TaxID=3141764 RepID=A0ABU9UDP8_9SPIR
MSPDIFKKIVGLFPQEIIITDYAGRVCWYNSAVKKTFSTLEEGTNLFDVLFFSDEDASSGSALLKIDSETVVSRHVSAEEFFDGSDKYTVFFLESDRKKENLPQGIRDSLTGLMLRDTFITAAQTRLDFSARLDKKLVLFIIDIDGLKKVNDAYGHDAGNNVLRTYSRRILEHVGPNDLVARSGGDEFIILLQPDDSFSDFGEGFSIEEITERILSSIRDDVDINSAKISLSASAGISVFPDDGEDLPSLMRAADAALMAAKRKKNAFFFCTPELHSILKRRLWVEQVILDSLKNQNIQLLYQPIIDLNTSSIHAVEVLSRMREPEGTILKPDEFVPIMEENGTIHLLGQRVLYDAMIQGSMWQEEHFCPHISVNISTREFLDRSFPGFVSELLEESGFDSSRLILEITESSLINDIETALHVMKTLREIGIKIALDDFGTGYSSFSYLKLLPVDLIKLDKSFLSQAENSPTDRVVLASLIEMSHVLGKKVIVEGVETYEHRKLLEELGCDFAQGYLLGRPMREIAISQLVSYNYK